MPKVLRWSSPPPARGDERHECPSEIIDAIIVNECPPEDSVKAMTRLSRAW